MALMERATTEGADPDADFESMNDLLDLDEINDLRRVGGFLMDRYSVFSLEQIPAVLATYGELLRKVAKAVVDANEDYPAAMWRHEVDTPAPADDDVDSIARHSRGHASGVYATLYYRGNVLRGVEQSVGVPLVSATRSEIEAWFASLATSESTRAVTFSHVKMFFRWADRFELRDDNPDPSPRPASDSTSALSSDP
jgi:hypothetical protein